MGVLPGHGRARKLRTTLALPKRVVAELCVLARLQYALSLLAVLNGRERVREAAETATQKGVYQFSRDVHTSVDGPPAAPCPTGVGAGAPGTAVVAVELAGFLEAGEAGWKAKERSEKEGSREG